MLACALDETDVLAEMLAVARADCCADREYPASTPNATRAAALSEALDVKPFEMASEMLAATVLPNPAARLVLSPREAAACAIRLLAAEMFAVTPNDAAALMPRVLTAWNPRLAAIAALTGILNAADATSERTVLIVAAELRDKPPASVIDSAAEIAADTDTPTDAAL